MNRMNFLLTIYISIDNIAFVAEDFTWATVGRNIRDRRLAKGMTQAELAENSHLSQPGLFRIEAGNTNPQLESLKNIAVALGSTVQEIMFGGKPSRSEEATQIFGRVQRILQSNDHAAKQIFVNGLDAAEALLARRDQRHHISEFVGWGKQDAGASGNSKLRNRLHLQQEPTDALMERLSKNPTPRRRVPR